LCGQRPNHRLPVRRQPGHRRTARLHHRSDLSDRPASGRDAGALQHGGGQDLFDGCLALPRRQTIPDLLHGREQRVYGDSAYASQKAQIHSKAPQAKDFTNQRIRPARGDVDEVRHRKNRNQSRIRASVEHVFAVVKRLWGFAKVRYRGLAKNACRAFTALALANIFLSRKHLVAQVRP
jgi:hypothetical protein